MKSFLVVLAVLAASVGAKAAEGQAQANPLFTCGLSFNVVGGGVRVIVGKYQLKGMGELSCVDNRGNKLAPIPVKVVMGTSFIAAPNIAIGHAQVRGVASGIGLTSKGPASLYGTYYTGGASIALVKGVGANLSLHGRKDPAVTLNLSAEVVTGNGITAGFDTISILPAN